MSDDSGAAKATESASAEAASTAAKTTPQTAAHRQASPDDRRSFLGSLATLVIAGLAFLPAIGAAIVAFCNPLRQKSGGGSLLRVANLDQLPADGTPVRLPVVTDRDDAWSRYSNQPVGAVLVRRVDGEDGVGVEAFQVICPHAGCHIVYDDKQSQLFCPCHAAAFTLDGARKDPATSQSPRDLDTLETEIRNGTEVWLKYQEFQTGTTEKVATA